MLLVYAGVQVGKIFSTLPSLVGAAWATVAFNRAMRFYWSRKVSVGWAPVIVLTIPRFFLLGEYPENIGDLDADFWSMETKMVYLVP